MTYATKQNMIDQYGEQLLIELTDRAAEATGEIDDTVLNAALADADALIDSYASRRYDVPFTTTPAVLRQHAEAIAWYKLHRGRHREEDRQAYDDAIKFLTDMSSGLVRLDVGGTQPASAPAEAVLEGPERTFSRDTLKGF